MKNRFIVILLSTLFTTTFVQAGSVFYSQPNTSRLQFQDNVLIRELNLSEIRSLNGLRFSSSGVVVRADEFEVSRGADKKITLHNGFNLFGKTNLQVDGVSGVVGYKSSLLDKDLNIKNSLGSRFINFGAIDNGLQIDTEISNASDNPLLKYNVIDGVATLKLDSDLAPAIPPDFKVNNSLSFGDFGLTIGSSANTTLITDTNDGLKFNTLKLVSIDPENT
ncbi:hypothetical protein IT409_03095, partial [Candidatus Falkowbacteria bacterium]|nr:hypothetical protein [Candidatus Falkowbacteria bacterium]